MDLFEMKSDKWKISKPQGGESGGKNKRFVIPGK
jgi:hypothetical protein